MTKLNAETQYIRLLGDILNYGTLKENRTGIPCYTIANTIIKHDMGQGFPLFTHRKLPLRSTLVELEGFLRGITSKKWYQERKCKYWDKWANPLKVNQRLIQYQNKLAGEAKTISGKEMVVESLKLQKQFQEEEDDLGPLGYSWQLRRFNEYYHVDDGGPTTYGMREAHDWPVNGCKKGFDQLKRVCHSLKKNPNDRRMLVSYWNPLQEHMMALPPCHTGFQLVHIDGTLHLSYSQRSVDVMCNQTITTYAALLLLFCKYSGFKPGILTAEWHDTHIYQNHLSGVVEILDRDARSLPTLEITHEEPFSIEGNNLNVNWTHKDYKLSNYDPHPAIKFEVAV